MTDPRDELIAALRRQLAERDVFIADLRAELAALKEAFVQRWSPGEGATEEGAIGAQAGG